MFREELLEGLRTLDANQRKSRTTVDWGSLPEVLEFKRVLAESSAIYHAASDVFRHLCEAQVDIPFSDLYQALGGEQAKAAEAAAKNAMLMAIVKKVAE